MLLTSKNKLYPEEIVATVSQQLSWSKFIELITIDDPLKRKFYTEICKIERWTVRDLRKKISGMLYERTAISQKPGEEAPLGLILCANKKREQIELLELDKSGIHVAQYLTELPPMDILEARLHRAIKLAQERNINVLDDNSMDDE